MKFYFLIFNLLASLIYSPSLKAPREVIAGIFPKFDSYEITALPANVENELALQYKVKANSRESLGYLVGSIQHVDNDSFEVYVAFDKSGSVIDILFQKLDPVIREAIIDPNYRAQFKKMKRGTIIQDHELGPPGASTRLLRTHTKILSAIHLSQRIISQQSN